MNPSDQYEKLFQTIPRTKSEMDRIRESLFRKQGDQVIDNAHKHNARIEMAKRIAKMFQSEEFQHFWRIVFDEIKELSETSVSQIKGTPAKDQRYDPFGQLAQLNNIQGGLEMLESMDIQKRIFEETAKGEPINVEELKSKLQAINKIEHE